MIETFLCNDSVTNHWNSTSDNQSIICDVIFQKFLRENRLLFDNYHRVRISITFILFVASVVGNSLVLLSATLWRTNHERNHSQTLIIHLSLANLVFTICILPMDGIWNVTLQWLCGDIMCRIMNVLKQFSLYISSSIIMVMSIDRVLNLLRHVAPMEKTRRAKTLLVIAWIASFLNAIPGGIMFSVKRHHVAPCSCPDHLVVQCVDFTLVEELWRNVFYLYTMFISFFIPLITTIICYVIVAFTIAKMARKSRETHLRSAGFRHNSQSMGVSQQCLERAKHMSQLNTVLITVAFIICWGPYYVAGLLQWFGGKDYKPNDIVEAIMLMTSYLTPCLHPLITLVLMKDVRKNIKRKRALIALQWRSAFKFSRQSAIHLEEQDNNATKHVTLFKSNKKQEFV